MDKKDINTIVVLRNILKDEVFSLYVNWVESGKESDFALFLSKLIGRGGENNFMGYIADVILCDENVISVSCASGKSPSVYAKEAYVNDIKTIFGYIQGADGGKFYNTGKAAYPLNNIDDKLFSRIKRYYRTHGYGIFIKNSAFSYDGTLLPIENPSDITLNKLKDYEDEKRIIADNIEDFLHGRPYNNMLLYGDRGTGKSSTIHAMLNKYFKDGLRIIEINKENMLSLPKIRQMITNNPLKFIIFIDDLSLNESDDKISGLKAALEGSVSGSSANTMIVATSNRRHIIKESFSDRNDSVHRNDSLQEQLSLSDRFGITVLFSSTGKAQYLSIVKQLAADVKLDLAEDELFALAEKWALYKGGRSPRRAKQFIDLACSCRKQNRPIDF